MMGPPRRLRLGSNGNWREIPQTRSDPPT
jgi:hypothetical protein